MTKMENLIKKTAAEEDQRAASILEESSSRDAFIEGAALRMVAPSSHGNGRLPLVVGAAIAMVIGLAGVLYLFKTTAPSPDSQWVHANQAQPRNIDFPDGSSIRFETGARARVAPIGNDSKQVTLETGKAIIHVVHHSNTNWQVLAGPFTVKVLGTRFDVSWDATLEYFELALHEGEVIVTGPLMEKGQVLVAGRILRASLIEQRVTVDRRPGQADSDDAKTRVHAVHVDNRPKKDGHPIGSSRPATAAQLMSQANAARTRGALVVAEANYRLLRKHFPATVHAAIAAFFLGRMAFDQKKDFRSAARWFETYLKEQEHGTLRREAMGRLMDAYRFAGEPDMAKQTARGYLEKYPQGPYARRAKEIARE